MLEIKDCQIFNVKKVSVLSFQGKEKKDCWEEEAKRRLLQEVLLGSQEEQVGRGLKKRIANLFERHFLARAQFVCISKLLRSPPNLLGE